MKVEYQTLDAGGRLTLAGELDHHAAGAAMRQMQALLGEHQPGHLELDMGQVSFMDSSGLALLFGAQKAQSRIGGTLRITKLSPQAKKVVAAVGLHKIIQIDEQQR